MLNLSLSLSPSAVLSAGEGGDSPSSGGEAYALRTPSGGYVLTPTGGHILEP